MATSERVSQIVSSKICQLSVYMSLILRMDSFLHFERTNLIKLSVQFLAATFKFLAFIGVKVQIIETGFLLFE